MFGADRPACPHGRLRRRTPLLELLRCPFCRSELAEDGRRARAAPAAAGRSAGAGRDPAHAPRGAARRAGEAPRGGGLAREGAAPKAGTSRTTLSTPSCPFVNRELGWDDPNWLANGHSFQVLLDRYVGDQRGLRVLEVGAAKAWAARFWLERDCEYVATDILVDQKIGLGRGAFYGDFGRVQADGEHLRSPTRPSTSRTASRRSTTRSTCRRWCARWRASRSRGGVVAGLNEGTRGLGRSSENPDQAGEKELGINEHVHTVVAYLAAFARAGLVVRRMERSDGWPPVPFGYFLSRIPKVGMTLGTLAHLSAGRYAGVSIYARRR